MNDEFIKLHRKILEWEWYQDTNTKCLLLHCILKANPADKSWQGQIIRMGTFITSIAKLSNELNISIQTIKTSLKKLQLTKEITCNPTNKYTIINIVKYNEYQCIDDD